LLLHEHPMMPIDKITINPIDRTLFKARLLSRERPSCPKAR
jgi:hypothetical protein